MVFYLGKEDQSNSPAFRRLTLQNNKDMGFGKNPFYLA